MPKDYYKSLGINKNASKDEIKKAFRKLAHEHHPDKNPKDADKFKEISEAYSVLSDDSKRAQYDQFGSAGPGFSGGGGGFGGEQGQGGFGGFDFSGFQGGFGGGQGFGQDGVEFDLGDIFGSVFGGGRNSSKKQRQGRDIELDIEIDFKSSIFGKEEEIKVSKDSTCAHCKGTRGEPNSKFDDCGTCHGTGTVYEIKRTFFGQMQNAKVCDICFGTGKIPKEKCHVCKGQGTVHSTETINVIIPPGINPGDTLKVQGKGESVTGGLSGDLYIKLHVKKHPKIIKDEYNLIYPLEIKLTDALLGADIKVEALDGDLTLTIPAGISHGELLRVRGRGVPMDNKASRRGDLLFKISVNIPKRLSRESKKLLEDLRREGL